MYSIGTHVKVQRDIVDRSSCNVCKQGNEFTLTVEQDYFVLFWLRLFPLKKRLISVCKNCNRRREVNVLKADVLDEKYSEVYEVQYPKLQYYSGLIIIGILACTIAYFWYFYKPV